MSKYRDDYVVAMASFLKQTVAAVRGVKLSRLADDISHEMIVPQSTYAPWCDDREFAEVYELVKSHTLVDIYRCYELWYLVRRNRCLTGDILEVGVWRGGTGCLLGRALSTCSSDRVYLADTFSGVVKPSEQDTLYRGGEHADTSEQVVLELASRLKLHNVQILKGVYPDQVSLREAGIRLRLCHIDVDTYDSAKQVFEDVWPLIVSGGMVIFDDFGFWGCEGVTRLCNQMELDDATFVANLNGHQIVIKR